MRLAAAIGAIAVTLAVAWNIQQRQTTTVPVASYCGVYTPWACPPGYIGTRYEPERPSQEDPVAMAVALGGVAVAAGILTARRRPTVA